MARLDYDITSEREKEWDRRMRRSRDLVICGWITSRCLHRNAQSFYSKSGINHFKQLKKGDSDYISPLGNMWSPSFMTIQFIAVNLLQNKNNNQRKSNTYTMINSTTVGKRVSASAFDDTTTTLMIMMLLSMSSPSVVGISLSSRLVSADTLYELKCVMIVYCLGFGLRLVGVTSHYLLSSVFHSSRAL